jgi:twinkle protein
MISEISINKVKDTANIVDVIGGYLELKKNGANYVCLSPFSNEKSPSFTVSPSKNIFKCFSTGKGGDCLTFLMEYKNINYIDAIKLLAEKYTIELIDEKSSLKPIYVRPIWKNNTMLSDKIIKWFEGERKISQQTLNDLKISEGIEWMPKKDCDKGHTTNTIQFNYFVNNQLINTKYRDALKMFKLVSGAELVLYNLDSIKDSNVCYITEGEIDVLTLHECGFKNVVSVPNGANKGKNNLAYLDNSIQYLEHITEFILCLDNDENGNKLKDELARRFGYENCKTVTFKDCKDANDCLKKYGKSAIIESINEAKEFPIIGVFNSYDIENDILDYYNNGLPEGTGINMQEIDTNLRFHQGYLTMITGIPGHGKSELLDFILVRLNLSDDNWKTAYFSPENHPLQLHFSKLAEKLVGKSFDKKSNNRISPIDLRNAIDYCSDNFYFINPEDDFTITSILKSVKELIKRKGIKAFVIDAWNKLDHKRGNKDKNDYISEVLDTIVKFCERNGVHCFLVAHPTKMGKDKDGKPEVPSLYNISDSAHFFNKTANGICIYRNFETQCVEIHIQKVKFKHWGQTATIHLAWNRDNGRYYKGTPNNDNWLTYETPKPLEANNDFLNDITINNIENPF